MKHRPSSLEKDFVVHEDPGQTPTGQFEWRPATDPGQVFRRSPAFLLFIVAVAWLANYLHFAEFGFYEDDWYFFANAYSMPTDMWFAHMVGGIKGFLDGRPLHIAQMHIFGWVGAATSSIPLLYLCAFSLFASSAVLMYFVLRLRFPKFFCAIATIVFVLSPLVTVKQFLNGQLTFGPAFTCSFLALLLYSSRWRAFSYVPGVMALLTYEPIFLLFMAAPLFQKKGRWKTRYRRDGAHVLVCLAIIGVYAAARHFLGQERQLASVSSIPMMTKVANAFLYDVLFTVSSLKSYIYALYVGIREISLESAMYCVCFFLPLIGVFFRGAAARRTGKAFAKGKFGAVRRWWWIRNGMIGGILFTVIGYSFSYFTLYHDWLYPLSGRDTRVSVTASFGSSILVAASIVVVLGAFRRWWMRLGAHVAVATGLAGLFLYSFVVQQDYVREWARQRSFLTQVMMLSPDVSADTLFIVKVPWVAESQFPGATRRVSIGYQQHGLQVGIWSIFGWSSSPAIFVVYSDEWKNYLQLKADKLYWTQTAFPGGWARNTSEPITPGHIIVMEEREDGSLARVDTPISVGGIPITQTLPALNGKPQSNWTALTPSSLLSKVVSPFVTSAVMLNTVEKPFRSGSAHLAVNLAVKFPAVEQPFKSGLSEPLVVTGQPGRGDFVAVHYYGQNTLSIRVYHWGFPGVESGLMHYDPNRVYFISVVMGDKMTATIAGGLTATYQGRPYPAPKTKLVLGRNPIGGSITTETFSGEITTSEIIE